MVAQEQSGQMQQADRQVQAAQEQLAVSVVAVLSIMPGVAVAA